VECNGAHDYQKPSVIFCDKTTKAWTVVDAEEAATNTHKIMDEENAKGKPQHRKKQLTPKHNV
jgi:hypothetical protein